MRKPPKEAPGFSRGEHVTSGAGAFKDFYKDDSAADIAIWGGLSLWLKTVEKKIEEREKAE